MNEDYYHEQSSCYDSNSFGFDQFQPPQYTVNHPIFTSQNELLNSSNKLMEQMTTLRDLVDQAIQKKEEEKRIAEEQAARDRSWKIPICYDDDEDNTIAITPVLPIEEPDNSLNDILREKLLNVNLLIAKIDALRDNLTPSSEVVIKSTSTFPNLFLEETNTFDNSIPESETFRFNLEEISSGSPTTHSELSLPDYKAFYIDNDHFKEKSSGSTTTHVDFSQYDSFIFDLSNDQFPPADRSDFNHEEFADELTHIMSPPELECFKFKIEPDPGDLDSIDLGIRKNASTTNVNVPLEDDQSSLFAYVVWIFLAFLTYPVVPPYLLSTRNEDTIFDPGISMYHSFMPDVSHRSGTFMKFNDFPDCEDSLACSIHMSFTSSASVWESSLELRAIRTGFLGTHSKSGLRKPKRKDTQVPQPSGPTEHVADEAVHKELGDSLMRAATTASSLEAEQVSGNITKTRSKATPNESSSLETTSGGGPRRQETVGDTITPTRFKNVSKLSNDLLLTRESSGNEEDLGKDATKQGRMINNINADEDTTLVNDDAGKEMFDDKGLSQDKGKGILVEPEKHLKKKYQLKLDEVIALKLQVEIDKEEIITKDKEEKIDEANIAWDDIQAKVDADYQLAKRLQAKE
ncbi:hypothetical protein Tco_1058115 [Tanacetum coccineum]|uniref:Uncharacterized protein n=1 Tax=Tanacetum coccineum TaxID=301880 RepID=A0ABQ5H7S9_9ASTR